MKVLRFATPLGLVTIGLETGRVVQVALGAPLQGEEADPHDARIRPLILALSGYLGIGEPLGSAREAWQVLARWPVVLRGVPPKYRQILSVLRRTVPFGTLITYGELARRLGTHPRVVGQAMARNPVPLLVPCHRVVSARGIGGFGPGLAWKRWLWQREGIKRPPGGDPAARG